MTWSQSIFSMSVLLCLTISSGADARDWFEYKSENFTVYSDVSQKRTENLLQEMERFRTASLLFTGLADHPESHRLQIFFFNSRSEFGDFAGDHKIAGFYRDTWDGPLIFAQKGSRRGLPGSGIMFHEYVHHLMRTRSRGTYPIWYSEGFAELLASAVLDEKRITVGRIPQWRTNVFNGSLGRPLKVEELLLPDTQSDSSRYWHKFYGSAWLLTHYLQVGSQADHPEYRQQTTRYITTLAEGGDPLESFTEHFGISPEEMESQLRSLRRSGRIMGYSFDSPQYTAPITRQKVSVMEASYLLAEKALDLGEEDLALEYLDEVLKKNPDWTPGLSLMAVLQQHKEDEAAKAEAAAIIEKLRKREIAESRTATHLAHYYIDQLQDIASSGQWDHGLQQFAREYGEISVVLNPQSVSAHRYLWLAQRDKESPVPALKTMMAAYNVDPSNLFVNQQVGFYLVELDRVDLAKPFLERVVAWSHPGRTRTKAQNILNKFAEDQAAPEEQNARADQESNQS